MKGNLIKKFGNTGVVLILVMGALSSVIFFSSSASAEAIDGVQVVAADGEVSFDKNEDGYIDAEGNDDIGIEWNVDYAPATTYIRIISGLKVTTESFYDDGNCKRLVRWCDDAVSNVFGRKNTVQIWYGSKIKGYSEVKFDLPRLVEEFPIPFIQKSSVDVNYLDCIKEIPIESNNNKAFTYTYSESSGKKVVNINHVPESDDINNIETNTQTSSERSKRNIIYSNPNFMENMLRFRTFTSYFLNKFFF